MWSLWDSYVMPGDAGAERPWFWPCRVPTKGPTMFSFLNFFSGSFFSSGVYGTDALSWEGK